MPDNDEQDNEEAGEQAAKTQPTIQPDANHSYGFDAETVKEQLNALTMSDEIADLKKEVGQLKERMTAVEAALTRLTQQPPAEAKKQKAS